MVFFIFIQFKQKNLRANSGGPDLVLHCLPISHKKDARLIGVKFFRLMILCLIDALSQQSN